MYRIFKITFLILIASMSSTGCAFFNTFYLARKAYHNGTTVIERNREQLQTPVSIKDVPPERFSRELATLPMEAKTFFDEAIERSNKVIVLWPKSGWAEDATLLLGKAHYLRGQPNDWYDAKNRLEVFLTRYPESKKTDEAKLWYGKTLLKLGAIDEAEESFRQITETAQPSPFVAEAFIRLGDIAVDDADYKSAGEFYVKATELSSRGELKKSALYKSFYTFYRTHEYRKAAGYLNVLLGMDLERNERFELLFMKARTLKAAGDYRQAIEILNDLIGNLRYKNYFILAEFEIADVFRLAGRNSDAVKQFEYVIDTYKNPLFTGDCYYFLGQIYDQPVANKKENFSTDHELAKKYYYLINTRYAGANYFAVASERYNYMTRMDFFKGSIAADEIRLKVIDRKINDPDFKMNMEEYFPSVIDTTTWGEDSIDEKNKKTAEDKIKSEAQKEILSVKIVDTELDEKKQQVQNDLLELALQKDPDTLKILKGKAYDLLAYDYVRLADYFYFDLSNYDSAAHYYQFVVEHFPSSSNIEFALYGYARSQFKMNNPDYLSYYRRALEAYPNGRFADIGRKALALEESLSDSVSIYTRTAEESVWLGGDYAKAAQLYTRAALIDSTDRKLQAMYAAGLLYEKKLDLADHAFRVYNTLAYAVPNSDYAKKVRPKVEAYAKEKNIAIDSLKNWIDSAFMKVPYVPSKTVSTNADAARKKADGSGLESGKSRLPEGILPSEEERMQAGEKDRQKTQKVLKKTINETENEINKKIDNNKIRD